MVTLTSEQQSALDSVLEWSRGSSRELTLGGYAGTGKTTLIRRIVDALSPSFRIGVCALSGKAAYVLRTKGLQASTIHALIYTPRVDEAGNLQFDRKDRIDPRLTIVDEASMVDDRVYRDILSFNTRVLWVGDHGQLEPIGDNPGLMSDPQIRLETIMRQALESPILRLAHALREDKPLAPWASDDGSVEIRNSLTYHDLFERVKPDQIIVGTNDMRHRLNAEARKRAGRTQILEEGDRVICLRNNYAIQMFNGMQGVVKKVHEIKGNNIYADIIDDEGREIADLRMNASQFGANPLPVDNTKRDDSWTYFDYSYAITCHKAQGSEWNTVVVFEQIAGSWDRRRWSYTAATRAKKSLVYVRKA